MPLRAIAYLLLSNVLGGTSYIATVYALKGFSVSATAFWRTAAAAVFLSPSLAGLRRAKLSARDWLLMIGVGLLGYAAPILLGTWGTGKSSATHGVLLVGIEPVTIVLLAAVFLGESLTWLKGVAMALGLAGASMIVTQGRLDAPASESGRLAGDLLLSASGFMWALYTLFGKPVLRKLDAAAFTAMTTVIAVAPLALAAWPLSPGAWSAAPWQGRAGLAYLAVLTALGAWSWNKAVEAAPASQVANFVFLQPLVGVLLGVLLAGESLSAWSAAGGALIMSGVYAATKET